MQAGRPLFARPRDRKYIIKWERVAEEGLNPFRLFMPKRPNLIKSAPRLNYFGKLNRHCDSRGGAGFPVLFH
jgi:hypothetical protein